MKLAIIRHAHAENLSADGKDSSRKLTEKGQTQVTDLSEMLKKVNFHPDVVLSSPYVRCAQTSKGLCQCLGWPEPTFDERLGSHNSFSTVFDAINEYSEIENVVVVGHQPYCSELLEAFVSTEKRNAINSFKKAQFTLVETKDLSRPIGKVIASFAPKGAST
ncbi:MAG: hypothetical protein COT74_02935 [Bdellovibrionales bacterium CG10_big_fil_rev_8_21_14_0_10_45_34]|nr:MAG: hypothetical protein COT74_02935 [Bdellovibrionales bacterium CG10_big_fil_rev_8_21_14_0_10_45_34]